MSASKTGIIVDCGSGHTSIMTYSTGGEVASGVRQVRRSWLRHVDGGNLPLSDIVPSASGGAFKGTTLASRLEEFILILAGVLEQEGAIGDGAPQPPCVLFIGATGGLREEIARGRLAGGDVTAIRAGFERAFAARVAAVRFEVLSGEQEATWEYDAAQIIWGGPARVIFAAGGVVEIGLFSGGGKSMQLGRRGEAQSFPFSTFPAYLEERQGAAADAWLDAPKWQRFEDELREKVQEAAAGLPNGRFTGCFVGTAMNHRAAQHSGFAGVPITAAAAVAALRASLPQFRSLQGEVYERMMSDAKPGSSYPLARITAMHTFRLATVLEAMFAPESQFFFARNGLDAAGSEIDCEWTVGAFAQLARSSQ